MVFEIEGIVVITGDNTGRGDDQAMLVHDGQNIAGLTFLAPLIGDRLAAFLRQTMRAIQVQFRYIQVIANGADTLLPQVFETAIAAPLGKMQIDRGVTDFFFSASGDESIGNSAHWQPVCSQYRM